MSSYNTCCPQPVAVTITNYTSSSFPVGYLYEIGVVDPLPTGALLCDGSAVSRTVFAELFVAIGVTYGQGDGATTFNLPTLDSTNSSLRYVIQAVNQTSALTATIRIADLTVVNSGTTSTVTIQVQDSNGDNLTGNYAIHYWFVDSATALDVKSAIPPELPGVNESTVATNSSGLYTLSIEQTGDEATWYLVVSMNDQLFVSSAITAGV
ncbi:tail fiber protein [Candidatus Saccharibacteria bacterium]|nr:tail fiber protein [Candidatus Saccharibacteria bacterium]